MKNKEAYRIYKQLVALKTSNVQYPVAVNFARFRTTKILQPIAEAYEESRNELLEKYGISENGISYTVTRDNLPAYNEEVKKLDNIENEVKLVTFNFTELNDLQLTPSEYDGLASLAVEVEEK